MEAIRLNTHVGSDGILKLETPVGVHDVDCDVVVVVAPRSETSHEAWKDFVNATYGSLADDPIERGKQPPLDVRDAVA